LEDEDRLRSRDDIDLSAAVLILVDVPPSLRAEWHFIKKMFIVVATSLLGLTGRLRHCVLSMGLLFVPQWGSGHLAC
jgi:hypothetical protein